MKDKSSISSINRRRLVLGSSMAMTAGVFMPGIIRAQGDTPIKLGHLTPLTGFLGPMGEFAVLGATLAVEEVNAAGGVMGRPLEMLAEDSVNPQTASTKAQRMIERDKVTALVGEISSASGLAISQVANRAQTVFMQTGCNSDELRGANCSRYMFHLDACNTMYVRTIGQRLLREGMVEGKRWMAFTADYAFGHDLFKQMSKFMEEHGAEFVSNDMIPTEATEFSAALLKIRQQKPDIVISNLAGNQTTNFTKQYNEFDIDIPFAGADMNMTSIWGAGKDAFSGTWPIIWTHQIPSQNAQDFVKRFQARWDRLPENQSVGDYLAIKMLAQAMNETNSLESDKIIEYLESGVEFDVLRERTGYFRPWDHQLMYEMYTVTPSGNADADPFDFMVTSDPVPDKSESLEILAPTKEENMCNFA